MKMLKDKWLKRLIFGTATAWVVATALVVASGLCSSPQPADLALVLGNTVTLDGRPMPRLEARLTAALDLYGKGLCSYIMVSGGVDPADGRNEAAGMKRWLVEHGVPADAVIEDDLGDNTRASAEHAQAWLAMQGKHRVIAVSQYFHLPRIRLALRQAGAVDSGGAYPRRWFVRDIYSSFREVPGYLAYWLGVQ